MVLTDPIGDLLTRIRNAQKAHLSQIEVNFSKMKKRIADVLAKEGYVTSVRVLPGKPANVLQVELRYDRLGKPMIREIRRLSKPGCRIYAAKDEIPATRGGVSTVILSTSRGLMTDRQAREENLGGELICRIV